MSPKISLVSVVTRIPPYLLLSATACQAPKSSSSTSPNSVLCHNISTKIPLSQSFRENIKHLQPCAHWEWTPSVQQALCPWSCQATGTSSAPLILLRRNSHGADSALPLLNEKQLEIRSKQHKQPFVDFSSLCLNCVTGPRGSIFLAWVFFTRRVG